MCSFLSTSKWVLFELVVLSLGIMVAFQFKVLLFTARRIRLPFPPGPSKKWIIGNLSDIPTAEQWIVFTEWAKRYGNIVHARVLQTHLVVLNDVETAIDLLDKRSTIYSSRAPVPMLDMIENLNFSSMLPHNDRWREHRRMFQGFLKPGAVGSFERYQYQQADDLLCRLRDTPDQFLSHLRLESSAIMMSAIYDYNAASMDDHYLKIVEKSVENIAIAAMPGAFLVNDLPFLRHVPEWFPGGGFKAFVRETKMWTDQMRNDTLRIVQNKIEAGEASDCLAAQLLEGCQSENQLNNIKSVCATAYAAGAETSSSTLQGFFYAMVNFPDVQRRAQQEIDEVIGWDRLPTLEDRTSLPYIEAVYRESLRWHPVTPIGVPHYTTDEDVYNGYYIPKGTTIIPNVWAMTRDPRKYQDPEIFDPSRFLEKDGSLNKDDVHYLFGFGRRICPGRHLAAVTIWLSIVRILATFDIKKKKDSSGKEIQVDRGYSGNALAIHPHPFECDIAPRSEIIKGLIPDKITQPHS
ncbi:cytochrome P450 [Crepidotus variabilis]|uniref:Cytochrome P450 n=1 Tax=Crepidotus variabilis TaxID=179855 RepID=A0A9P6E4F5_9AGAR|nr:cytochrome P450 [Crepidotus variabilis]